MSICKNISLKLKTFVMTCMPLILVAGNLMFPLPFDTVLFIKLPINLMSDVTKCISRLQHENVPGAGIVQWRCTLLRKARKCASARIITSQVYGTSLSTKTITTRIFFSNWLQSHSFLFVILVWPIVLFYLILLAHYFVTCKIHHIASGVFIQWEKMQFTRFVRLDTLSFVTHLENLVQWI